VSEAIALAFEEREYTLPQLDALANGMATVLQHRGVRPGARVALMSSNRPEFVIALRAIWRLGASAVLLSPAWKRIEVEHALAKFEEGTYGRCENCGQPIAPARLEAKPGARLCINCASRR